jgi:sugar lactone lactonase YvrE
MTDFRRGFIPAAVLSLLTGLASAQPYLISTYVGGLAAPTAVPGVGYALEDPNGVATDAFGNTYISSSYNCIFRLDANRNLSRVAGNCRGGFSGDGGNALNAELNNPQGIALDAAGNLYIADQGNQRIRLVTPSGIISTFAGNGKAGYSGDDVPAIGTELNNPQGVVVDPSGNVYIADSGNYRIRLVNLAGTITTFAGTGAPGSLGDGSPAALATFTSPTSLTLDSKGDLYITDTGANVVRMVNPSGTIVHIAGTGSPAFSGDGQLAVSAALNDPQGLALDAAGNLYIADRGNYRVRVVEVGGTITTYAGNGVFGYSGDNGQATSAELLSPFGVATDYSGDLYIADQIGVVRMVNSTGTITTVAGNASASLPFSGDGGPAALAELATPWGIAFDSSTPPNMYVADYKNNRVRKITPAGAITQAGVITTFAGNGIAGDSGNGEAATSASVTTATLAVDSLGNVYLADTGVVRKVDTTGTISTVAGTGVVGDYLPGLAVDSQQNIYIADWTNQVVRKVTAATGDISTFAGTGSAGYSGDGNAATSAMLQYPAGLALDKNGNLYIADNGNCVVRMVSKGTISTVAGNGTCGSAGDSGPATAAQAEITNPWGVVVDGNGNLYIATQGNTIRKVAAGTGIISTIAGNGTAGYSGDGGLATSAQFNNPLGLAVDSAGNVYVSDFGNGAVRVLQPETEPLLTAALSHSGSFPAGGTGIFYITVGNAASAGPSGGAITVTATLPAGLTATGMSGSGSGWSSCSLGSPTSSCTNSGSINAGQSLGALTLTVNVPSGPPPPQVPNPPQVTNEVVVSGGGALATGSEDLALVGSSAPVLQISATHSGDFLAGAQGTFTITVGNQIAAAATNEPVTVTDTLLPTTGLTGLTLSSLPDNGWNCSGTTCTNSSYVAGGVDFPPLTGTVNVASGTGSPLTNKAQATGGGSSVSATATDSITVVSLATCEAPGYNSVTVSDVQAIVNQGLGSSKSANDINQDGVVNVVDIQIVINAVLYSTCTP